jgi:hypothetical protein
VLTLRWDQRFESAFLQRGVDCKPDFFDAPDRGAGTTAGIEEERRLLYVAMTRARDDLHLVVPQRFFTHGQNVRDDRHVYAPRSRFIPDGLLGLFERVAWPEAEPELAERGASQGVRVDIAHAQRVALRIQFPSWCGDPALARQTHRAVKKRLITARDLSMVSSRPNPPARLAREALEEDHVVGWRTNSSSRSASGPTKRSEWLADCTAEGIPR